MYMKEYFTSFFFIVSVLFYEYYKVKTLSQKIIISKGNGEKLKNKILKTTEENGIKVFKR